MISGSATNPELTERGMKGIFRTVGRDDQQGPAIAAYIVGELKGKRAAIVDDKTAYGEGLATEVEKALRAAGVTIVGARAHHRQGNRLQGDPHAHQAEGRRRRLPRRHGRDRRAHAQAGARAGDEGHVHLRRRRVHRRDGEARGPRGRRARVLAGRSARPTRRAPSSSPPSRPSTARPSSTRRSSTTRTNVIIEAMRRADSVDPAKFGPEIYKVSLNGATGQDRVRRQGRSQGCRDDDLPHAWRQDLADRDREGRRFEAL